MNIEIYADILFLICLIPEVMSLWLLTGWHHLKTSRWRMLWVGMLATAISVSAAIGFRTMHILLYLPVDMVIQMAAFRLLYGRRSWNRNLEDWFLQKVFFVGLGGLLQTGWRSGSVSPVILLSAMVAGGVICGYAIRYLWKKKQLNSLLYPAEISWNGRHSGCMALLDTGNQLFYGADTPVILLDPKLAEELGYRKLEPDESFRIIPYSSVGCASGILQGFVCDSLVVSSGSVRKHYEGVVAAVAEYRLSGKGEYQMLLHPALLNKL